MAASVWDLLPGELKTKILEFDLNLQSGFCATNQATRASCAEFWANAVSREKRYWEKEYMFNGVYGVPADNVRQDMLRIDKRRRGFERILDLIRRRDGVELSEEFPKHVSLKRAYSSLVGARIWAPRHWRAGREAFDTVEQLREALLSFVKNEGDERQEAIDRYGEPEAWILTRVDRLTDLSRSFFDHEQYMGVEGTPIDFDEPIGAWDTSNVKTMHFTFRDFVEFNQPIGAWNTSKVTTMHAMFTVAEKFNQPIGGWDTSKVTSMAYMFDNAYEFNQPIGDWDTSNVEDVYYMFSHAYKFDQPLHSWNTSQVRNMEAMFDKARSFNQPICAWKTSNVKNMTAMFRDAAVFNQSLCGWDISKVTTLRAMFRHAKAFNKPLCSWNTSKVATMSDMFRGAHAFNQPIGGWDTSGVVDMQSMFKKAKAFNQPIGDWNTSNVQMLVGMFRGAESFRQDIFDWSTAKALPASKTYLQEVQSKLRTLLGLTGGAGVSASASVVDAVFAFHRISA